MFWLKANLISNLKHYKIQKYVLVLQKIEFGGTFFGPVFLKNASRNPQKYCGRLCIISNNQI